MKIETYKVPEGQRRAGMFSFRVDDKESLFFSTSEDSITSKINDLMKGRAASKSAVVLEAIKAGARPMLTEDEEKEMKRADYLSLPTADERFAAFMSRGKLAEAS